MRVSCSSNQSRRVTSGGVPIQYGCHPWVIESGRRDALRFVPHSIPGFLLQQVQLPEGCHRDNDKLELQQEHCYLSQWRMEWQLWHGQWKVWLLHIGSTIQQMADVINRAIPVRGRDRLPHRQSLMLPCYWREYAYLARRARYDLPSARRHPRDVRSYRGQWVFPFYGDNHTACQSPGVGDRHVSQMPMQSYAAQAEVQGSERVLRTTRHRQIDPIFHLRLGLKDASCLFHPDRSASANACLARVSSHR